LPPCRVRLTTVSDIVSFVFSVEEEVLLQL